VLLQLHPHLLRAAAYRGLHLGYSPSVGLAGVDNSPGHCYVHGAAASVCTPVSCCPNRQRQQHGLLAQAGVLRQVQQVVRCLSARCGRDSMDLLQQQQQQQQQQQTATAADNRCSNAL
jgi:hypothetical protein